MRSLRSIIRVLGCICFLFIMNDGRGQDPDTQRQINVVDTGTVSLPKQALTRSSISTHSYYDAAYPKVRTKLQKNPVYKNPNIHPVRKPASSTVLDVVGTVLFTVLGASTNHLYDPRGNR